jgi:hypothetical protein
MTERDWLHVGTEKHWTVYGLMDPTMRNHVFYVGITKGPVTERVRQHKASSDSAAWSVIKDIEEWGQTVGYCIFASGCDEGAALHLESALITVLPQIVNRTLEREGAGFWRPFCEVRFAG